MQDERAVIVGAGAAGGECAIRLRQAGYAGEILLIGGEPHLPYHRPPLSKAYLSGQVDPGGLLIRAETAYRNAAITFIGGVHAIAIDRAGRSLRLEDGQSISYSSLVLATGGKARRLACPGGDLDGLYLLRTLDDVDRLRARLAPGLRLAIIGGGYIGLEVAAVAVKHGLAVTVIEAAPRLLARVAGPELSAFYEQAHREAGVTVLTGASVQALNPNPGRPGHLGGVVLADGTEVAADFALAGIGLVPHTELAEACGLAVQNGIVVDEFCRTGDAAIYAIGDCSNHPSRFLGRRVRLESVPNALEQARVTALAIAGKPEPYDAVPWFWSDQYDLKLQSVGIADGYDQAVLRGSMAARSFVLFYLRAGTLIAADAVNKPGEFLMTKRLVAACKTPDPAALADPLVGLKTLL
jgi:3-phenylpropionate/trans-cinnamate dioxygenase ferredoxin reductase subunit